MKRPKEGGRRRMRGGEGGGGGSSPVQQQSRVVVVVLVLVVSSLLLSSSSSLASASVLAEDLPRITRHPESAIIAHHLPVTLHCQAHPPSATLRWLFNGAPLRPSSHPGLQLRGSDLHFGHFRHGSANGSHGNDGEYRCTASTSAGTVVSRPAVLSKPVLHAFPRSDDIVMEVYEGGFTTIPCSAPFSLPPATVRVLTSRGDLLDDSHEDVQRLPSGSVVLKRVGADRADNYTCVAFNPVSGHNRSASHRVRLSVLPSPPGVSDVQTEIVDRSTPTLEVREGRSVVLECPVTGVGVPSVTWTRGYGTLPHGHSLGPFGNLHISSVKLRDVGTYICQTPGGHKRQVFLDVHRAPSVTPHPPGGVLRAREGEGVRLVCKGGALPAPTVTWFHDGQRVPPGASVSSVGEVHTLHLEEVAEEDGGLYVCELTNSVGQDSAVLQLVVTSPHSDRQWHAQKDNPSDASREENSEGEATPADSQEAGNKRNFHLEVSNNNKQRHGRKRKKGGRKKKRRKNKKKGGTRTVKLVPPSAPTVSQLTESSVLVLWKIPENDGLPISLFRVQYREVRPSSGQWQTVEDDISPKARRYKVTRLKAGGTYKFRIAAVYSNNDNRNSPNSRRFHLNISPNGVSRPPTLAPRVVEAKPFIYQNIYAIGIKWQYIPVDGSSITGFYIFYKPYGSEEDFHVETLLGAGIRNHLLTDLKPDTEYSVKMQCFNSAGASDFSNMVVKRTLPLAGQAPAEPPTPVLPPSEEQETEAPPSSRRASEGLEQPVILGIVLGGLLLLLAIFLAMCWWKQRQQKRRNQSLENSVKYPGDHRTLYSDSLRTTTTTTPPSPRTRTPTTTTPTGGPTR
ncbi:brother of CDO-like [Babylonia areolata]|uniref:brother of CDO-like n=1 Tax=Babylonia areolata TaxID=304850 RepID=UPI003FD4E064